MIPPVWLLKLLPIWGFIKKHWIVFAIIGAAIASFFLFEHWKDNLVASSRKEGFDQAQAQYKVALDAANKVAAHDDHQLDIITTTFGGLANQRVQDINLKVEPTQERLQHEIATDPRYSDCRVSDSVRGELNSIRATVDSGIASSNPKRN